MQQLTLTLTIEETNLLLEGLGNLPFRTVFQLVQKIQNQAAAQLQAANGQAEADGMQLPAVVQPSQKAEQ